MSLSVIKVQHTPTAYSCSRTRQPAACSACKAALCARPPAASMLGNLLCTSHSLPVWSLSPPHPNRHTVTPYVTFLQLVDLHKLECTSLKRYRRAFQLGEVDAAAPKADLATAVQRHFTSQVREENLILTLV